MVIQFLLVFIAGLTAGTFISTCIYRIPRNEPIIRMPRCDNCGEKHKIYSMLPVFAYIVSGGRCKNCKTQIPWNSPLVEIITGAALVLLFKRFGWSVEFAAFSYLVLILVPMVFIDIKHRIIPNGLVFAGLAGGTVLFAYNLFVPFGYYNSANWWEPLAGMLPGSMFLFLILVVGVVIYKSEDVMGMGDVKIFAPVGMFLGWKMCIVALLMSLLAGGITGIALIIAGTKKRGDTIPFGPFIALGTFITIIAGWDIFYWYI